MPRQEKKGGVNLPRHRVELYFIDRVSGVKCPGRKKGGANLPGYRVAHPMLYIKKGKINYIYLEPCCISVTFSASTDCLSLFLYVVFIIINAIFMPLFLASPTFF
jgi:hypothetical protein